MSLHRTTTRIALATGALVLGVTGSAQALPGKNSVDHNDIRSGAVSSSDLRNGQVKTPDLAFGSVTGTILGDGSVNSLKLLDNSVASVDVTDNSLTGTDVKDESLTGTDVKDESLTGTDVQDNSLTGADVTESTLQGIMPAQTRFVSNQSPAVSGMGAGSPQEVTASCPADERAIGGGGAWIIPNFQDGNVPTALADVYIAASMPAPTQPGANAATGWTVTGRNVSGSERALRAYAICVPKQLP